MKRDECLALFGVNDMMDLPAAVMKVIEGDQAERNRIYRELVEMNGYDMSHDWFQEIYESELSERKQKKQDFTPRTVSELCAQLVGPYGSVHEPTAGNGSMLISAWHADARRYLPFSYFPSQHMFDCWELSDRSIPILLLNLSIRGMMGIVHHGDVLTKEEKCRYIILNRHDDFLAFSEIVKDPECRCFIKKIISYDERTNTKPGAITGAEHRSIPDTGL